MTGAGRQRIGRALAALALLAAAPASAETARSLNFYGQPGGIDMPSGQSAEDGQLSTTLSHFGTMSRLTLSFQFTERLSGAFRYARFGDWNADGFADYYDRSFDIRYRILDEGRYLPAVTVGLQDFMGTGLSSAEYVVATKTFGDRLTVTAGLGWGRLGSYGSLGSPFGTRPGGYTATGGTPNTQNWFRGPVAPFGGVEYAASDRLSFKLEYSSDNYDVEGGLRGIIDRRSPLNLGVEYRIGPLSRIGVYYLYGSTVGIAAQMALNPRKPRVPERVLPPPPPLLSRQAAASWGDDPGRNPQLRAALTKALAETGLVMEALKVEGGRATIHLRNPRLGAEPLALGRTARAMANLLPTSVETLTIVPVVNGIATSAVTFRRSDLEELENTPDGGAAILGRTVVADGFGLAPAGEDRIAGVHPRLSWAVLPSFSYSVFDPSNPFLYGIGIRGKAELDLGRGVILRGSLMQQLYSTYDRNTRVSNSVLPHVRSDGIEYLKEGDTVVESLTASWYFRPGRDLYGRVSAGYLERMFGGISAELLWKPVDSRLALGAEANLVQQRAFDGGFGFRDYSVATGHLSAYYELPQGYHAALHAGRYLAGDWGATLELNREFANGWKIGAFATLTDVPFSEFGEGSFDKGIRLEIPTSFFTGTGDRARSTMVIRPVTRDGGARLNVDGRLYGSVRDYHREGLSREWGTFWK